MKFEEFKKNELLKRASTRSIEIIGEAVKNISLDFRNKHNEIDWKKIAGMRDIIIHYYLGVNWDTIWDVIKNKIPVLKAKIEILIEENKDK
ncbi:DUF86 domain-containing protein [Candidatus Dependentiae bacterium]|nr:DUF86 domain-containing protein [Candidatus Dependentiae bacterium]